MNGSTTTLVLGGGFGGIVAARKLRDALPEPHRVVLVSQSTTFQLGATKTWVMLGEVEPDKVSRPLSVLKSRGIETIQATVNRIDPDKMEVTTSSGTLQFDYLVIALGAHLSMDSIDGLSGAAETFYTRDGAVRLRDLLKTFQGGRIALLIPKTPFQCPPGPYEGAMLLHSYLSAKGLRDKSTLDIYTVEMSPMATAGPEIGKYVIERLSERNIGFHPQSQVQRVDGAAKAVVLADGTKVPYDLLLAIPPHTSPEAVRASGLINASGWIPANPNTLEWVDSPKPNRIFAIGDVTSVSLPGRFKPDVGLVLPKAGVFAEREAIVVASRIAAHVAGKEAQTQFDGQGFCYIEVGDGKALRGDGNFFNLPHPSMLPREPDAAQQAEKKAWVDTWMSTYL